MLRIRHALLVATTAYAVVSGASAAAHNSNLTIIRLRVAAPITALTGGPSNTLLVGVAARGRKDYGSLYRVAPNGSIRLVGRVGWWPSSVAAHGSVVWVANGIGDGSRTKAVQNSVTALSTTGGRQVAAHRIANPDGVAIGDAVWIYSPRGASSLLTEIDPKSDRILRRILVGGTGPGTITTLGHSVFVATTLYDPNGGEALLSKINTSTRRVVATRRMPSTSTPMLLATRHTVWVTTGRAVWALSPSNLKPEMQATALTGAGALAQATHGGAYVAGAGGNVYKLAVGISPVRIFRFGREVDALAATARYIWAADFSRREVGHVPR